MLFNIFLIAKESCENAKTNNVFVNEQQWSSMDQKTVIYLALATQRVLVNQISCCFFFFS